MMTANHAPISVVIPAYNEQDSIGDQVAAVKNALRENEFEIIVVNDGSGDKTSQNARTAGARVVEHSSNLGYGAALKTGIRAASFDAIGIIDADGTYPADSIPELASSLQNADMVVGARTGSDVNVPTIRKPAKYILRKLATRIAEQPIPDLNSGLRVFRKDCVQQYFPILPDKFSFTSTVTLAYMSDGYHVRYLPVNYHKRIGKSKIIPWHFMDFLILILRLSMMFNPLKVFLPLALFFGSLGVLKALYDVTALFLRSPGSGWSIILEPVLSTSAVFLMFVGLQLLLIGMVADGVVRRIAQHNPPRVPSQYNPQFEDQD
jgi:glycosyltransferase involved in cell wall biosynthesis